MANRATKKLNNDLYLLVASPVVILTGIFTRLSLITEEVLWADWHTWKSIHAIASIVLYYLAVRHVIDHWKWYKKHWFQFRKGLRHVWLLSLLFALTALSGLLLFFSSGESVQGLSSNHVRIGVLTTLLVIYHIVKYFPVMSKWIKYKRGQNCH